MLLCFLLCASCIVIYMSGHSKWKQIKHKKALTDAKRGTAFSKMVREITIAARTGDPNPEVNIRLKAAVERAHAIGLPKDNIERAIAKAAGRGADSELFDLLYEATAPGGVAMLIKGVTDNKNRTVNEIKHLLSLHGARLAEPGSVLWNFERVGTSYRCRAPLALPEIPPATSAIIDAISEHDDIQEVYTNL